MSKLRRQKFSTRTQWASSFMEMKTDMKHVVSSRYVSGNNP